MQQSRARQKTDFLHAFEPQIADATALAYKNASVEIQNKIKRVVEVWRQRNIFDKSIQEQIEKRVGEIDKTRGAQKGGAGGGRLGGSLFGGGSSGSVPAELEGISKSQSAVSKAEAAARGAAANADSEFTKMTDPNATLPTPPVHAARLNALMKTLATAQGAMEASINARKELLAGLEKLIESNRTKLSDEENAAVSVQQRLVGIETRKKEVEDGIMRGMSSTPTSPINASPPSGSLLNGTNGASNEPSAPEPESFTPPPPDVESFTPPPAEEPVDETLGEDTYGIGDNNPAEAALSGPTGAETITEQPPMTEEPPPAFEPPPVMQAHTLPQNAGTAAAQAADILGSLQMPHGQIRQASSELQPSGEESADPRLKRRKMAHSKPQTMDEEIFGSGGVDEAGVDAMLQ